MESKLAMGRNSTTYVKKKSMFHKLSKNHKPLIGMIHLPALPGYTKHPGMKSVIDKALTDLETLQKASYDGILVENDNDQPHQIGVSQTIAQAFAKVMEAILREAKIPVGMEIIYDMLKTIEIAHKVGAQFVRLDVFVDDVETKWGMIKAQAKEIVRLRGNLDANRLLLLTDIHVKHAKLLKEKSLALSAKEAMGNGSDGLIITGMWTGKEPPVRDLRIARKIAAGKIPVLVGSGFSERNAKTLLKFADGAIVGTSIKTGEYVDLKKAQQLVEIVREIRATH